MISTLPIPWVIESANNGNSNSQFTLGMLCYSKEIHGGVLQSITLDKFTALSCSKKKGTKAAEFWFRKSAENPEPLSKLLLAYTMELRKTSIREKIQILNLYILTLKQADLSQETIEDTEYRIARLNFLYLNKEKGEKQLSKINVNNGNSNILNVDFS